MKLKIFNYVFIIEKDESSCTEREGGSSMEKERLYDALDVARYVVNYYIEIGHPITNLKLQKLLYYIQAGFITELKQPCFKNDIINWRLGPVIREVYDEFKCFGNQAIDQPQSIIETINYDTQNGTIEFQKKEFKFDEICTEEHKQKLDSILETYVDTSSFELVSKTHSESPWLETKQNEVISNEHIKEYFEENPGSIRGIRRVVL